MSSPVRVLIFCFAMILCAAATNGVMDVLTTRYDRSIFARLSPAAQQWWNPALSWPNKWKNGDSKQGEAFPLSSTSFVFTTDAWHCFKFITIVFIYAAIFAPFTLLFRWPWYCWLLLYLAVDISRGLVFELFYTKLLL